jgi:hypothetical protein
LVNLQAATGGFVLNVGSAHHSVAVLGSNDDPNDYNASGFKGFIPGPSSFGSGGSATGTPNAVNTLRVYAVRIGSVNLSTIISGAIEYHPTDILQ